MGGDGRKEEGQLASGREGGGRRGYPALSSRHPLWSWVACERRGEEEGGRRG